MGLIRKIGYNSFLKSSSLVLHNSVLIWLHCICVFSIRRQNNNQLYVKISQITSEIKNLNVILNHFTSSCSWNCPGREWAVCHESRPRIWIYYVFECLYCRISHLCHSSIYQISLVFSLTRKGWTWTPSLCQLTETFICFPRAVHTHDSVFFSFRIDF